MKVYETIIYTLALEIWVSLNKIKYIIFYFIKYNIYLENKTIKLLISLNVWNNLENENKASLDFNLAI